MRRADTRRLPARRRREGVVLLETIAALTILAVAGASVLAMSVQSMDAVRRAQATDRRTQDASAFLDAVMLWTRDDLDRHLGDRPQGKWVMHVDRPTLTLYTVALRDSGAIIPFLTTAIYRAEVPRATP